jgi:NAD-dependent dihydropyrimidine dehydrogenase PreA subunit
MTLTYIRNGETLALDAGLCNGCGACIDVCPHAVFAQEDHRVEVVNREGCMECGACARNCPAGAIRVRVGVGCAAAIIGGMIRGTEPSCGCSGNQSNCCG